MVIFARAMRRAVKDPASAAIAARASVGLGRIHLVNNALDEADVRFVKAQELAPSDCAGYYWAGCTAGHRGDYARAERCFSVALMKDGNHRGRTCRQRAYARLRLADPQAALDDLRAADECQALDERGRLITALLLLHSGRWELAESFAGSVSPAAQVADLSDVVAAVARGFARHQLGRLTDAFPDYQRALAAGFRPDPVLELHGMAAYRLGHRTAAIDSWSALARRHPGHPRFAHLASVTRIEHIRVLVAEGKIAAARKLLGGVPSKLTAQFLLSEGARLIVDGQYDVAREALTMSWELNADDPRPPHLLAQLAAVDGDLDKAESLWDRLPPDDQRRRLGLALCAISRGEFGPALADLADLAACGRDLGIRRRAAHLATAARLRRGEWTALDAEDDDWSELRAEALYRTGRDQALIGLPDTMRNRPWQDLARTRRALAYAASPNDFLIDTQAWDGNDRPRSALARLCAGAALDSAEAGDWKRAVTWLRYCADLDPAWALGRGADPITTVPVHGVLYGLIYGLGGDRASAISLLGQVARRAPEDYRAGHVRALMLLHTLSAGGDPGNGDVDGWSACIGAWISLLADHKFLANWRTRAQSRYGEPVTAAMVRTACVGLHGLMEQRISGTVAGGEPLSLLLRREAEAARVSVLRDILPGGPLRVADLGFQREFGTLTAAIADTVNAEDTEVMRRLFSRAGLAAVQLSAGHPAAALQLALDVRCPDCRTDAPDGQRPAVCCPECRNFDRDNPVFASSADKRGALADTAASVAVDALLELARTAVSASVPDSAQAARSWKRAVDFAEQIGRGKHVRQAVTETARGRAKALDRRHKSLDHAISVLDAALKPVADERHSYDMVAADLARLLNFRGVETFDKDAGNAETARRDLTRALELNPGLIPARGNLGAVLHSMGIRDAEQGKYRQALAYLQQAVEQYERGLRDKPDDSDLTSGWRAATRDLSALLYALLDRYRGDDR